MNVQTCCWCDGDYNTIKAENGALKEEKILLHSHNSELESQIATLKHDLSRQVEIGSELATENERLRVDAKVARDSRDRWKNSGPKWQEEIETLKARVAELGSFREVGLCTEMVGNKIGHGPVKPYLSVAAAHDIKPGSKLYIREPANEG